MLTQKDGYEFAKGFIKVIADVCILFILIVFAFKIIRNQLSIGTDDSDKDGWNRSELRVHLDSKTGIEYLSTKEGGLIRRESK